MNKPVLIVIDMLNDFLGKWEPNKRQKLIQAIDEVIVIMRSANRPIIWVRQEFEPDLRDAFLEMRTKGIRSTIKGTQGCQIVPELTPAPSDVVIVKKRYSAFYGTKLDAELALLKPDAIVLAGINTHACIRTTAIDAYQRDWAVVLASDCIESYDQEHHEISLRYMQDKLARVMSNKEIQLLLSSSTKEPGSDRTGG
jgi:nicotinamidase-related amidase